MANTAQHQRRKAAKAARRKATVAEKKRLGLSTDSLADRIRFAAKCPIFRCVIPSVLFELGIGLVVIARRQPSGLLGCGYFLVDTFCLGVKDAFFVEMGEDELQSRLDAQDEIQKFVDLGPACARKLIRDAVAYAADLGLAAANDYHAIEPIFGDADAERLHRHIHIWQGRQAPVRLRAARHAGAHARRHPQPGQSRRRRGSEFPGRGTGRHTRERAFRTILG